MSGPTVTGEVKTPATDVLVYGVRPGGIACAVRAGVAVNHTGHLGGLITSGAGGWETPCAFVLSSFALLRALCVLRGENYRLYRSC